MPSLITLNDVFMSTSMLATSTSDDSETTTTDSPTGSSSTTSSPDRRRLATTTESSVSWEEDEEPQGLWDFIAVDSVVVNNVIVNYSYSMSNCLFSDSIENYDIGGTCGYYICANPVPFIKSEGTMTINKLRANIDITTPSGMTTQGDYQFYEYDQV